MASPPNAVLLQLLQSGEFSDFTLVCKDRAFKLHQMMVCPQSPVIRAALHSGFKETTSKVVTVNGFDLATVQYMVTFLYTGDYKLEPKPEQKPGQNDYDDDEEEREIDEDDDESSQRFSRDEVVIKRQSECRAEAIYEMISHLRVNAIADYYGIEKLSKLSTSNIGGTLNYEIDLTIMPRILVEMSTANRDSELRSIVTSAAARYISALGASKVFRKIDLPRDLMIELLEACGRRVEEREEYFVGKMWEDRDKQAKHDQEQSFSHALDLLLRTEKCRHCRYGSGWYLRKPMHYVDDGPNYALSCASCGSPHFI